MELFIVYLVGFVLVLPSLIIGSYVKIRTTSVLKKYAIVPNEKQTAAVEFAAKTIEEKKFDDVSIAEIGGIETNRYNSKHKVLKLSPSVVRSTSITALGVTAFELGHVVQDHSKSAYKFREKVQPYMTIITRCFIPLLIVSSLVTFVIKLETLGNILSWISVGLYALSTLFHFSFLAVEFAAKKYADKIIDESNLFNLNESAGAKNVTNATKRLYIIEYAMALVWFLKIFVLSFTPTIKQNKNTK